MVNSLRAMSHVAPLPSTHSTPWTGRKVVPQAPKGGSAGMVKNTYVSYPPCFLLLNGPPSVAPLSGCAGLTQREASHLVLRSLRSPTARLSPIHWCDPSSLTTPIQGGRINLSMLSCRQRTAAFLFPMNCLKKNSISRFFPQGRHFLPSFSFLGNNRL